MANNADGTDGKGVMHRSKSQVSGKNPGAYGSTASRSMAAGKTVSGKEAGEYGTTAARNVGTTHFPQGVEDTDSAVSKHGGRV